MKRILLLSLLLLPIFVLAQYPTFSNKQKLGVQTTGDGLIYRGNSNPNYNPSNINNAYFYLDTTASKLYLYSVGTWQQIYPTASDTISLGAYLLKSDTLAMLLPYLRKSDTISLSNRINNKLNATDTVSLSNRINLKLNKIDTINLSNRIDLKLNKSDTISLSNRINIKLNASDTVSLSNRINKKLDTLYVNYQTNVDLLTNKDTINIIPLEAGTGINITNNVINLDTTLLDSVVRIQNIYVKNGTGTVLNKGEAVYVTGANGTNIIVGRASNVSESSSSKTLGLTMTSIAINGFGYVIKEGLLEGLNTNSANNGDPIWLGVNGAVIYGLVNKPYAPNHLVYLGIVTRKQQNNGEVYVTVQNGFEIKELHDVQIIEPVNKASLYYNSSQSLWRDTTAALLVSDTTTMLSKYVNTYSNQTGINGDKTFNNVITIDSATVTGKLLVNTNISDAVKISSNTNSTNLELMNSSGIVSIKSSNKNMILQTDTTALVYLNGDNKKVGILTMNPQQELEVNGNARITGLNNNLVPLRIVGSSNNNDLTNVNLGEGLSFANDTLKVDLTIIDTAIAASSITLTGHVTGTGSTNSTVNTTISNGVVTNDMLAGSIADTKLNTITTVGKVSNTATTATASNTASTIVLRDNNRDFTARNITATNFLGNATTSTGSYGLINSLNISETLKFKSTNPPNTIGIINMTTPGTDFSIARIDAAQTFIGTQTFNGTVNGLTSSTVGLSNVDNTSDLNKPISTATQTALNLKLNISDTSSMLTNYLRSGVAASTYLPLTGGTLSGALNGTTGIFNNRLGVGSFTGSPLLFASGIGNQEVHFAHSQNIAGATITLRLTNTNASFYDQGAYFQGIVNRGINEMSGALGANGSEYIRLRGVDDNGVVGVGIFNTNPSYNLDVSGTFRATGASLIGGTLGVSSNITANSFVKSGGLSTQFLKADGSVDANTYLTTVTAAYLPLAGGTLTGTLNGINQNLNSNLSITDPISGNPPRIYTSVTTGPSSTAAIRLALDQSTIGGANMFMGGSQLLGGSGTDPNIFFTDSRRAYASVQGIYSGAGTIISGHIVFNTTPNNATTALTERMRIAQDGAITMSNTLGVTGTTTLASLAGTGTRMVVASSTGLLSTQAIPSSGNGTVTNVSAGSPANGLSVATPTTTPIISMALADGITSSGVVSTGTQVFGGSKTFSSNLIVNTISVGKGNNSLAGNTVVGLNALSSNITGTYNTAVGEVSLKDNLSGDYNTALGSNSLTLNTTGSYNTAIGQASLYRNNANHNTAIGESAAEFTTGSSNTAVGSQAMYNLTTGTDNTIIGYNSNASIVTAVNQIVIGSGVTGQANNTVTIGSILGKIYNNYTTNATWIQTSDSRLKNIIAKDSLGLSFINRLNPITYTWKPSNDLPIDNPYYNAINNKDTTTVIHGFVAQEIKAALDAENCSTFNGWIKGDDGIEGISREMFINPLVKAIQELSAQIEILKAEIKELKKQ